MKLTSRAAAFAGFLVGTLIQSNLSIGAETFESVRSKVSEKISAHNSIKAKMLIQSVSASGAMRMATVSNGTYEHLKKGDLVFFRVDLTSETVARTPGQPDKRGRQRVITIGDGSATYTLTEQQNRYEAIKKGLKPGMTTLADGPFFDNLKSNYSLSVNPEEKIAGRDTWVIEAKTRAPGSQIARTLHYIDKATGVRLRTAGFDDQGRRVSFTDLSEIQVDAEIDPKRFELELPKGVKLVDLSK